MRAGGLADEVFVDWTVPTGSFNIKADINGQNPKDESSANDVAITTLFVPMPDTDGDSDPDPNDPDDDNDDLPDDDEADIGTNPLDNDSDNDGCLDGVDKFPLDPALCADTDNDGIDDKNDTDDDNDGWTDSKEKKEGTDPLDADSDDDGVIDSKDYCPMYATCTVAPDKETPTANANVVEPETIALNNANINAENINISEFGDDLINLNEPDAKSTEPYASISLEIKDWQTYQFTPKLKNIAVNNLNYTWNFGDGESSNDLTATHTYSKPGSYNVSLKITGDNDFNIEASQKIKISFFNLGNFTFLMLLIGLFLLLLMFLIIFAKRGKNNGDKE